MGLPVRRASGRQAGPGATPVVPEKPKTAVLEVTRSDNGDATYRLLIDGAPQALKASAAKWDDASPWESGNYGAEFSPLRGTYDAFLIEYPPNRSSIKFHLGTETGHSEGCIVTRNANIEEIENVLAKSGIPKNSLRFDVKGDFPIAFKLSIKNKIAQVARGGTLTLTLELTGGGAPGGVSKDLWFHIVADKLDSKEFELTRPEKIPQYPSRSSYPNTKTGILVRLPTGERSHDYEIKLVVPHAAATKHPHPPAQHGAAGSGRSVGAAQAAPSPPPAGQIAAAASGAAAAAAGMQAAAAINGERVIFAIDNYKILNRAPGPPAYFYTPSNYKMVLDGSLKTDPVIVQPKT